MPHSAEKSRLKGFAGAAWLMMLTQSALLIAAIFLELPARIAPEITILVGVVGAIAFFLHYDRE